MTPESPPAGKPPGDEPGASGPIPEIELLKVVVARDGLKVSAQWGIHPQMKKDLRPEEWKELTELMSRITNIVAGRFSQILSETEPDQPGSA
jgi:hypothetical protein